MEPIAAIFPGQGSQYPGMAKALRDSFPWTKTIYEEASDAVKEDLSSLCLEGDAATLQLTHNAQPCILVTSFAWFQVLKRELDFLPAAFGGHSLGEYTALVAAGALSLAEAAPLVRKRGELMQRAVPAGKGKMAAILGLDDEKVEALCVAASRGTDSLVVPVNYNAPNQVVIAGHATAVDRAAELGSTPEFKARKVIPLKVSAPFHSPLMKSVADEFLPYLTATAWKPLPRPVVFNVDAKIREEAPLAALLKDQLDHPVRWAECIRALRQTGILCYVEPGPGKVLTGLVKRILEDGKTWNVDSEDDFRAFEKALTEV
jgi:[acyl-carrier-protein] S-malonyltransferase